VAKNTNRAGEKKRKNSVRLLGLPRLSSDGAEWKEVNLEYYYEPPSKMSPCCSLKHEIAINCCNNPITIEQTLNGRYQDRRLVGGEVIIRPAQSSYEVRWDRENSFIILLLEPSLIDSTAEKFFNFKNFEISPHFAKNDPWLHQIGLTLKSELKLFQKGSHLVVDSLANLLAVHLLRHYSVEKENVRPYSGKLSQEILQQVTDYINDYLGSDLSLVKLASIVQMSTDHFSKLFKQSTGFSLYQYVIRQRVMRAQDLIAQSEYTIAQIASMVGFSNQSHLNRHFKRLIGVTPGSLRKKSPERTKKP
jgi:AraC family transcriptional regulator